MFRQDLLQLEPWERDGGFSQAAAPDVGEGSYGMPAVTGTQLQIAHDFGLLQSQDCDPLGGGSRGAFEAEANEEDGAQAMRGVRVSFLIERR